MSLRLFAGDLRGRKIEVPPGVRPTEGRVRHALLSIWREKIPGSRFLDLFAGSGAVGFEAWGAGASRVSFVERAARALAILERNRLAIAPACERLAIAPACEIVRGRLPEALDRRLTEDFDLIFADPPYDFERYRELIEAGIRRLGPGGELVVEHSARVALPEALGKGRRLDSRRYGESGLAFYGLVDRG